MPQDVIEDVEEPPLTTKERQRRAVILCTHFLRNMAYRCGAKTSPAGWGNDWAERTGRSFSPEASFWRTVFNNALDMCVLEFSKMFVEWNGRHHYRQVVKDPGGFKAELLCRLNMTEAEYKSYIGEMKDYRDKFVAHLDDEREMRPPNLDAAKIAVQFYHEQVVREADPAILGNLVATARRMSTAFDNESAMAASIYARIEQTVPPGRWAG